MCQSEQIKLNHSVIAKSSKIVQVNDTFEIKQLPIWRSFKIIDIPKSRVSAKLVPDFIIELTNETELKKLEEVQRLNRENKVLGIKGRPTKKNRRNLNKYLK